MSLMFTPAAFNFADPHAGQPVLRSIARRFRARVVTLLRRSPAGKVAPGAARWIPTLALAAVLCGPLSARAQPLAPRPVAPATVLKQVGVDQKLDGEKLPLDLTFTDETGKTVKLGDYFGDKPVLLAPVYYECPMLCTMTLDGMLRAFKPLGPTAGKDFEVVAFSFDPRETPELAGKKRENYLKAYGRPDAAPGWHFLVGDKANIDKLCQAIGFRFIWDDATQQFAHASAIILATPDGKASKYFYGLEYSTNDLRLGLSEASENKVGGFAEQLLLMCYKYDPASGKYSIAIMTLVRAAGVLMVVGLGTFAFLMIRREKTVGM